MKNMNTLPISQSEVMFVQQQQQRRQRENVTQFHNTHTLIQKNMFVMRVMYIYLYTVYLFNDRPTDRLSFVLSILCLVQTLTTKRVNNTKRMRNTKRNRELKGKKKKKNATPDLQYLELKQQQQQQQQRQRRKKKKRLK